MWEQDSSRYGSAARALHRHGLARDEVDADPVELFQTQRLAREPARIGRLFIPTAAVAFQVLTRRAGAEGWFASFLRHLAEHALQGTGEVALDTGGQGVRSTDQGFKGVVRKNAPGFVSQSEPDTAPVVL